MNIRRTIFALLVSIISIVQAEDEKVVPDNTVHAHVHGRKFFPIVVVLKVVVKDDAEGSETSATISPNLVTARWSEKPKTMEVDPEEVMPLEREFGDSVNFGKSQTATVWCKARFTATYLGTNYQVKGDLILEMKGKIFYRRAIKEILKEQYGGKVDAKPTVVMIKASIDEMNGKKGVMPTKEIKPKKVEKEAGKDSLLPVVK